MKKIEVTQKVKLFCDEVDIGEQEIIIDMDDEVEPWVIVSHCGEGFSLSLTNLKKLEKLIKKAKKLINNQINRNGNITN